MKKQLTLLIIIHCLSTVNCFSQNGFQSYNMPGGIYSFGTRFKNDLKVDANNNVWIAFRDTGLGKFDGTNWTVYTSTNSQLPSNLVYDVETDGAGNIWAGTKAGLAKFDGSSWTIYNTISPGLPNDTVYAVGINGTNIWVGTKNGVDFYNGSIWTIYNTSNSGIAGNEIHSFAFNPNGEVWIGTATGLSKFYNNTWTNYTMIDGALTYHTIDKLVFDNNNDLWTQAYDPNTGFAPPVNIFKISGGVVKNFLSDIYSGALLSFSCCRYSLAKNAMGELFFIGSMSVNGNCISKINGSSIDYFKITTLASPYSYNSGDFLDFDSSGKLWFAIKSANTNGYSLFSFDFSQYIPPPFLITEQNTQSLDINDVNAVILNRGDMHWDLVNAGYEVPKNSGKTSVFASALWIGGLDAGGNIHTAAQTYRQTGSDFWPGPIDSVSVPFDSSVAIAFDKIWKVNRFKIEEFKYYFQNGSVTNGTYPVPEEILTWPAKGNGMVTGEIAPFFDNNNNGTYNPYDGDYPLIKGDQELYWIFNDSLAAHTETGGAKFGFEIQASAYAYTCPGIADSQQVMNWTTFYNFKVINRSINTYHDIYLGLWADMDLGDANDDYVGCDTINNAGFAYNADNNDGGATGYGLNPPMQNVQVLKGPLAVPGDGLDNDRDGTIDEPGERCSLNNFLYYNNVNNTADGNPGSDTGFFNYTRSLWQDGLHVTYTCDGRDPGALINFMYPGTPYSTGLTEANCTNTSGDRRLLESSGPFSLAPGESATIDFAYVFTWDSLAPNGLTTSIARNIADLQRVKHWFDTDSFPSCLLLNVGTNQIEKENSSLTIYPNPARDRFTVSGLAFRAGEKISIHISDLMGREIEVTPPIQNAKQEMTFDIKNLPEGIYIVQIQAGEKVYREKLVKQ